VDGRSAQGGQTVEEGLSVDPQRRGLEPAGLGARAVAVLIDGLVTFFVLGYLVSVATGRAQRSGGSISFNLSGTPALVWTVLSWGYWVVLEHVAGTTVGKRMFRLRVVGADGGKPTWRESATRNVLRLVDGIPFFVPYVVGFLIARADADGRRLGDRAAGTRVVAAAATRFSAVRRP